MYPRRREHLVKLKGELYRFPIDDMNVSSENVMQANDTLYSVIANIKLCTRNPECLYGKTMDIAHNCCKSTIIYL